jgi:EmrB/QacA subfamily drug resistance transporter
MQPRNATGRGAVAGNPWIPMIVILLGTIMVVLDSTIVNVALEPIGRDLHATRGIEWVVTAYLVAVCVSQPAAGWLADRFGQKPIYQLSVVAFTLASLGAALSPNLGILIAMRALQGFGGGALLPVGMTIVFGLFPREEHGRAIGVWGLAAMAAPALGPTLGGWLVTSVNWHWLFLINLPIGIAATVLGVSLLPNLPLPPARQFDVPGFLTGGSGVALLVLGLSEANRWGWTSPATMLTLLIGAALLGIFIVIELRTEQPLLEVRMFTRPLFRLAFVMAFLITSSQFARLVFIPLSLEQLRDFTALKVGLILGPAALATALGMTIGGRIVDNVGPRLPVVLGVIVLLPSALLLGLLDLHTPVWWIVVLLCGQGLGMGLTSAPLVVAAMGALPASLIAQGSAMRSVLQQFAGAMGVALFGAVYAARAGRTPSPEHAQKSFNTIFFATTATLVIALALAIRLPGRRRGQNTERTLDEVAASLIEAS